MQNMALMALTLAFLGCGGAPPPPVAQEPTPPPAPAAGSTEVHARGGRQVTATVGRAGGTLEIDTGARLTIPPGALSEAREITFGHGADTTIFSNREGIRPLSGTLSVSPPLTTAPGKSLTLSIRHRGLPDGYSPEDLALAVESAGERRALGMGENQTRWENFPAVQAGDRLEGELTELPGMRLAFIVSR
jgi:hypothetical protein